MARQPSSTFRLAWDDDLLEFDARALQGSWTEAQYLRLSAQTNRLVELVDGRIEVVSMPTEEHQALLKWLLLRLMAMVEPRGVVHFAPLRLQIRPGRFREPDILLLRDADDPRRANDFWRGADLVVEIVSPDDPERDYHDKRADYAAVGVLEYWVVDPRDDTITIFDLIDGASIERGPFRPGQIVASRVLHGVSVAVQDLFAARPRRP